MIRGFFQFSPSTHDRVLLSHWLKADGLLRAEGPATNCQLASNLSGIPETAARAWRESARCLIADARLDYRSETVAALGLSSEEGRVTSDSDLVLRSWEKWGPDCLRYLHGDFAFAAWDDRRNELFLARDRQGCKPLYVFEDSGLLAFSTRIQDLRTLPGCRVDPDPMGLALGLEMRFLDKAFTAYRQITRLPPATWMVVDQSSRKRGSYWRLDPEREIKLPKDADYSNRLRELFVESVRARIETPHRVGAALSGGLDSSSVCGVASSLLREQGREPLMAFAGLLSKGSIFSEEKYIRAVVEQSGCEFHPFELEGLSPTAGVLHQIDAVGSPFLSGNLFIPEHAYMLASKFGARVYMEGYDGDNAIGHGVELFRDLARKGHWWRLYRELKAFHAKGGVFGHQTLNWTPSSTVRNYLWHTRIKNWSATRLAMRATGKAGRLLGLRGGKPPVVRDHFPPFLPKIRSEIWQRRKAALGDLKPHENTRHAHIAIISSGKHPWLIEMTTALAQSYGVELRLPFYDTRLIEFCAAIPEDQKLRDGLVRWVMRNAMEGYLPDLVRLRPEKSNYEINFAEVFRREELGRLKRLLVDQDLGLGEILDMDSVRGLVSRLEEGKLMGEGLASLHHIFTVALWLEHGWSGSLPMSTRTASSIIPPA